MQLEILSFQKNVGLQDSNNTIMWSFYLLLHIYKQTYEKFLIIERISYQNDVSLSSF